MPKSGCPQTALLPAPLHPSLPLHRRLFKPNSCTAPLSRLSPSINSTALHLLSTSSRTDSNLAPADGTALQQERGADDDGGKNKPDTDAAITSTGELEGDKKGDRSDGRSSVNSGSGIGKGLGKQKGEEEEGEVLLDGLGRPRKKQRVEVEFGNFHEFTAINKNGG